MSREMDQRRHGDVAALAWRGRQGRHVGSTRAEVAEGRRVAPGPPDGPRRRRPRLGLLAAAHLVVPEDAAEAVDESEDALDPEHGNGGVVQADAEQRDGRREHGGGEPGPPPKVGGAGAALVDERVDEKAQGEHVGDVGCAEDKLGVVQSEQRPADEDKDTLGEDAQEYDLSPAALEGRASDDSDRPIHAEPETSLGAG